VNAAEAARVLAAAGTFDARHTPPTKEDARVRAEGWARALHPAMPVEFAIGAVVEHYGRTTQAVMPAHVNDAWRAHARRLAEEQQRQALTSAPAGVPMPPELKQQWAALMDRSRV
jgi:hypothetical protein